MPDPILFERPLPHGPAVRIRRTSPPDSSPVTAALEVDRRAGTSRASSGIPPALMIAEGASDAEVLARLEPFAKSDAEVARLLRERGLR
jgi:hypothetical protein